MNLVKRYGCVVCKNAEITEQITEIPYKGDVPDVSSCDLSTYDNHLALGGKLFVKRPSLNWTSNWSPTQKKAKDLPLGGICDGCLRNEVVVALVENNNLEFATEKDLPPRKY